MASLKSGCTTNFDTARLRGQAGSTAAPIEGAAPMLAPAPTPKPMPAPMPPIAAPPIWSNV